MSLTTIKELLLWCIPSGAIFSFVGWVAWIMCDRRQIHRQIHHFLEGFFRDEQDPKASRTKAYRLCLKMVRKRERFPLSTKHRWKLFGVARIYVEHVILSSAREDCAKHLSLYSPSWSELLKKNIDSYLDDRFSDIGITLDNCFEINQSKDEFKDYFDSLKMRVEILKSLFGEQKGEICKKPEIRLALDYRKFLTQITITSAYLWDYYLVAGLMTKFDEQWKPVIEDYAKEIGKSIRAGKLPHTHPDSVALKKLDPLIATNFHEFQLFTFDCWLVWGPSIPNGVCDAWGKNAGVQLGYGDENNSHVISQIVAEDGDGDFAAFKAAVKKGSPQPIIRTVVVRPMWQFDPKDNSELGPIQMKSAENGTASSLQLDFVRVIEGNEVHLNHNEFRRYYSAYIWVVFVLCDRTDGRPVHVGPDLNNTWLDMFTFFEHGNVGHPRCFENSKRMLADKAIGFMTRMETENPDFFKKYYFQYACAMDDGNCPHCEGKSPGSKNAINRTRKSGAPHGAKKAAECLPIFEIISNQLGSHPHQYPGQGGNISVDRNWINENNHYQYSACQLPYIVDAYFRHLTPIVAASR